MGVPALGHPLAGQPGLRQRVAFDDRHPPVGIGQDAGRKEPAHTGAQHHRVVTDLTHLLPPIPLAYLPFLAASAWTCLFAYARDSRHIRRPGPAT